MELIDITITTNDLVRKIGRDEALELILEIDSRIAEEDFTVELLKRLTKSLESDMGREEIAEAIGFSDFAMISALVGELDDFLRMMQDHRISGWDSEIQEMRSHTANAMREILSANSKDREPS